MSPQMETVGVPQRLPLVIEASNRSNDITKDARLVNCYVEVTTQNELYIYKRPGLTSAGLVELDATGRGAYFWQGDVYTIFGDTLYRNGASVATGLDTTSGGTSGNGVYYFNQIKGATPKLLLGNGSYSYAYTVAGGITADLNSINIDYPVETVKGFSYLNGATYVMQTSNVIWGSAINSVSVAGDWTAINFITAQIEPDDGVAINKQLVYVIAFNSWSTEVFFDAGNPTASPLGPVQGSKSSYGCASSDSVQEIDDKLFWLCTNRTASPQIAMMDQLSVSIISTAPIDKILKTMDLTTVFSWQLKIDGHNFYFITFKLSNITLCYDIVSQQWHQWTDANGNYFPIVASTYDSTGRIILQHENNGSLYYADTTYYSDLSETIQVDIYTPIFDASTRRRKQLNFLEVIADQITGSVLELRCSDDDYKTWSNFRSMDLGSGATILTNCGTFKKRAYNLRHKKNTFFRIQAVEVQYDLGTL